jgi:protein-disulfide isomerase/uncharacterized membrane protein
MKKRIQLAVISTLLSIVAHAYLAVHYYPLKFGFASGSSICNLNAKFDCDAVSASTYSSAFGIPMAVWGAAFNAVLLILILVSWLEWTERPERMKRWAFGFSGVSVLTSLAMLLISLMMMHNYCIVCMGLYVLSFITFFALRGTVREPFWAGAKEDLATLWTDSRALALFMLAVPVAAFVIHKSFMSNLGDTEQLSLLVREAVADWASAPKQDFVAKPSLTMGPEAAQAKMTLTEFADFRCGHCKRASYSLHAFVKSHPDVRFEFYSFPLDGACNEKINSKSGISCRLAATVYCAEKEGSGKGWIMHDFLYENQDTINQFASLPEVDMFLSKSIQPTGLNWESISRCADTGDTMDAIRAQAKQGALVNVLGTPTLFANGKALNRGQLVPVLQAVHNQITSGSN